MIVTLESTTKIVEFDGVPARLWEGKTSTGIRVHCFVTRIAIDKDDAEATRQFEAELQECKPPSPEVENAYPLRMIL